MFQKITFIFLLLAIFSCKKEHTLEKDKIKSANWLLGKWETKTANGNLSESWKKSNDSTFLGESFFIKGNDTLHFETIILQERGEELFYSTTVKGQNNNKAVTFKVSNETENQLVFENPKHDYPQKITYNLIKKDSLLAVISGVQLGKVSSEEFGMKKSE